MVVRGLMVTRTWLVMCAGLCSAALAGQPPQAPPPAPPADAPADDEFIEFLGTDDVGDAAWWEFLKNSAPAKDPPKPGAPPQDAKS